MFIQTQKTPNPNSLKFIPGKDVSKVGSFEITNKEDTENELVKNMVKINGRLKPTDPKLEELVLVIKNIRNRYKRYLNQYQPDWNS